MTKLHHDLKKEPVELDFCSDMLHRSMMLGKQALQIELAVGLFVFHAHTVADIASKKVLRGLYASAGRVDCLKSDSPHYHAIAKRIGVIAALFDKLKPRTISKWIDGFEGVNAVEGIMAELKPLELMSLDDVIEFYSGVSRKARDKAKSEAANDSSMNVLEFRRRTADQGDAIHIEQRHIHVDIDRRAKPEEIQAVIAELMSYLAKGSLKSA